MLCNDVGCACTNYAVEGWETDDAREDWETFSLEPILPMVFDGHADHMPLCSLRIFMPSCPLWLFDQVCSQVNQYIETFPPLEFSKQHQLLNEALPIK